VVKEVRIIDRAIASVKQDSHVQWINDTWAVPWMDAKAEVATYIQTKQLPVTIFIAADSFESLWESGLFYIPNLDRPSTFLLTIPLADDIRMPLVSVDDIGKAVLHILTNSGNDYKGKTIFFCGDKLSVSEMTEEFKKIPLGLPMKQQTISISAFAQSFVNPTGIANMFHIYNTYPEAFGNFEINRSRELVPTLQSFLEYFQQTENKHKVIHYFKQVLKSWKLHKQAMESSDKKDSDQGKLDL